MLEQLESQFVLMQQHQQVYSKLSKNGTLSALTTPRTHLSSSVTSIASIFAFFKTLTPVQVTQNPVRPFPVTAASVTHRFRYLYVQQVNTSARVVAD